MKKLLQVISVIVLASVVSGCATVLGGPISSYQRTKPGAGQPQREIRVGALIADILLFWPGAVVDFATGAIYRPAR